MLVTKIFYMFVKPRYKIGDYVYYQGYKVQIHKLRYNIFKRRFKYSIIFRGKFIKNNLTYKNLKNEIDRNRKSLDNNDGRGLRYERANSVIIYSERMRTQLDDLRKELKDIDAILYYDKRKRSLTAKKKAELEKRGSEIRTIIFNIQ